MSGRRTALYRYFDAEDRLLYVGITHNLTQRRYAHSQWSRWWRQAVRCAVEWHDTRDLARAAEISAIAAEKPVHNVADTPDGRPNGPGSVGPRKPPLSPANREEIRTQAARYERAKTRYEQERDALRDLVLAKLDEGDVRWSDLSRDSGWDREHLRRMKNKRDEDRRAALKRKVDDAPLELGVNPLVNQLTCGRLDQLDEWLRGHRADWYAELAATVLAQTPEQWRKHVAVSDGAAAGHIPEDRLYG